MRKLMCLAISRYTLSLTVCLLPWAGVIYLFTVCERARGAIILLRFAYTLIGAFALSFSTMTEEGKRLWRWFMVCGPFASVTAFIISSIARARNLGRKDTSLLNREYSTEEQDASITASQEGLAPYRPCESISADFIGDGGEYFDMLLCDIRNAKQSIYLEYYIIADGLLLSRLLPALLSKVKEGCDVTVVYDAIGSLGRLSRAAVRSMRALGIKVYAFNSPLYAPATYHNSRDHRKIAAFDGRIAYMGGINLADEYANLSNLFGHWKDGAVRIVGECVCELEKSIRASIFGKGGAENPVSHKRNPSPLVPFNSLPRHLSSVSASKAHYMQIISSAKKSLYITTPYLAPDGEAAQAICQAIDRGVDVRIVIPGVKDKALVGLLTREFGIYLSKRGATVYEYIPGFIHQKTAVADGERCIIGSVNLDQRSFYHNYECGITLYDVNVSRQVVWDFLLTAELSEVISAECGMRAIAKLGVMIGRILSPLF